ncbi:MAG: hypothetical protein IID14_00870, partial [Candidatus Marinimicrobia bacterium]|nr:hypothetical protein [Candidatus Neomarinimicrobiota bacterium]
RFQYRVTESETGVFARIAIFDFSMDPVAELPRRQHGAPGDFSQAWDGLNRSGQVVANGVYYCRLTLGRSKYWTKVMVIR